MIDLLFLGVLFIGVYFIFASFKYVNFTLKTFARDMLIMLVIYLLYRFVVKRNTPGIIDTMTFLTGMLNVTNQTMTTTQFMNDILVAEPNEPRRIIELDAAELDPTLQDALIQAVNTIVARKNTSPDQVLEKFKVVTEAQDGKCGVCYEELTEETNFGNLLMCPHCNKAAHKDCLKKWFTSGQTICIYCRQDIVRPPHDATPNLAAEEIAEATAEEIAEVIGDPEFVHVE